MNNVTYSYDWELNFSLIENWLNRKLIQGSRNGKSFQLRLIVGCANNLSSETKGMEKRERNADTHKTLKMFSV